MPENILTPMGKQSSPEQKIIEISSVITRERMHKLLKIASFFLMDKETFLSQ